MWHDQGKFSILILITGTKECYILMQTPLELNIWLQSCETFINSQNNMKQTNLDSFFTNISIVSIVLSVTSDSFPLIISHVTQRE